MFRDLNEWLIAVYLLLRSLDFRVHITTRPELFLPEFHFLKKVKCFEVITIGSFFLKKKDDLEAPEVVDFFKREYFSWNTLRSSVDLKYKKYKLML